MQITLRPITESDLPFLASVYGSTRTAELAQTDWDDERKAAFVAQQFAAQHAYYQQHYGDARFLVVEVAGEPAGRLYVDEWEGEIRLVDVAILPEFRGQGVGSQLLRDLQAEARRVGKPLRIHVERFNPALALYDRLGFRLLEDKGVYLFLEWQPAGDSAQAGPR